MHAIRLSMLFGATLLLLGCFPPITTHPVGTTTGLKNDPALTGLWRGESDNPNDKGTTYFHFLPMSDGSIEIVAVHSGSGEDGDWSVASVTTATLRGNHFMNTVIKIDGGKVNDSETSQGSFPVLYRFERPDRIALYFMDEDATKAAIKAHLIEGTVGDGQYGDAAITAEPKSLDAFLASKRGIALFANHFATLTKME